MEEARQHPAVESDSFTADEVGLAILGGLGALGIVAGGVGYFMVGGRSILLGVLAYTLSRALMRLWQLARPHAFPRNRASPRMTRGLAIFWLFLSFCLSLPLWAVS